MKQRDGIVGQPTDRGTPVTGHGATRPRALVLTDIAAAAGERVAQRIADQGGSVLALRQDVAEEGSWQEVVAAARARFGKLHILVNNAGTTARQGIADSTVDA